MRLLTFLAALLLIIVVGGYFAANRYISTQTTRLLPEIKNAASAFGVDLSKLAFDSAKISSFKSLRWRGVSGDCRLSGFSGIKSERPFQFRIDSIDIGLQDFQSGRLFLEVRGADIRTSKAGASAHAKKETYISDENLSEGAVVLRSARYVLSLGELAVSKMKDPRALFARIQDEVLKVKSDVQKGFIPEGASVSGRVEFNVRNARHEVQMLTREVDGKSRIALDKDDLLRASRDFRTPLSRAEVALLAEYPLRTPQLLQIKYKAEKDADAEYGADENTQNVARKDAFRYVSWSYLLTREYGASFAKRITDAHETEVPDQSTKERQMDLQNARIGREYAAGGLAYGAIRKTIEGDPRVISRY